MIQSPPTETIQEKMIVSMSDEEIAAARKQFPGLVIREADEHDDIREYIAPDAMGKPTVAEVKELDAPPVLGSTFDA